MPTIPRQDSIAVRLSPGEALTITLTSPTTCTLIEVRDSSVPLTPVTLTNATTVVGPFGVGKAYLLQANLGAVTYSIGPTDPSQETRVAFQSGVAVTGAADTVENTFATHIIPGGSLGPNGSLLVTMLWGATNNANVKTLRVKFGGTNFLTVAGASAQSVRAQVQIWNRGAQNSQVCQDPLSSGFGISTAAVGTGTIDTSADAVLLITGQKATGGDTLRLDAYTVEIAYAP